MKKLILILLAVILLTACESGNIKPEDTTYKVEIVGLSEAITDTVTGLKMYKHKVKYISPMYVVGTSGYVLLKSTFDYGDVILIKKSQILNP